MPSKNQDGPNIPQFVPMEETGTVDLTPVACSVCGVAIPTALVPKHTLFHTQLSDALLQIAKRYSELVKAMERKAR